MSNDNRCVSCGDIIPEGRQVCPGCQAAALILGQGQQIEHKSVVEYLAEKYDIRIGVDAIGQVDTD